MKGDSCEKVVQLYIDGVYWGVYSIEEYVNAYYAASYLGGWKNDYDVVKVNRDGWIYNPTAGHVHRVFRRDG